MRDKTVNAFINPAEAEDRNVLCGGCGGAVKGHWSKCPHCDTKFHANKWGYARLCKNPNCIRTESAGHPHGLCKHHYQLRKYRQTQSALQANCSCGGKVSFGHSDCSRCRSLKEKREESQHRCQCQCGGLGCQSIKEQDQ
jgi:hypothetical protein